MHWRHRSGVGCPWRSPIASALRSCSTSRDASAPPAVRRIQPVMSPLVSSAAPAERPGMSNTITRATPNGSSRANVLHLIAPGEIGGAESVVRLLASRQRSLGAHVRVVAVVPSERAAAGFLTGLDQSSVQTERVVVAGRDYRRERKAIAAICEANR